MDLSIAVSDSDHSCYYLLSRIESEELPDGFVGEFLFPRRFTSRCGGTSE